MTRKQNWNSIKFVVVDIYTEKIMHNKWIININKSKEEESRNFT